MSKMLFSSVNGQQVDHVSINERTIQYGDGVFTTAKIAGGEVVWLNRHVDRLRNACQKIMITSVDWSLLADELSHVAKNYQRATLKVIISAGQQSKAYARADNCTANILIYVNEFPSHYLEWQEKGISIGVAKTRLGINSALAGLKHTNRLEQVLLKNELASTEYQDLLAFNELDNLIESISSNVFVLINNEWVTPKLDKSGVDGLSRQVLLAKFPQIKERDVQQAELVNIQAILLTNCLMPAVPISNFEGKALSMEACRPFISYLNEVS